MVWSTKKIKDFYTENPDLIQPYNESDILQDPAKIDLHLGEECYCSSHSEDIIFLKDGNDEVRIQPNDIFFFKTLERIHLPSCAAGRLSLRISLIRKGLLTSNLPQIDPGYNNHLFGMAYNLSDKEIILKKGDKLAVLELYSVEQHDSHEFSGNMQNMNLATFATLRIQSSLGTMSTKIENAQKKTQKLQKRSSKIVGIFSILLTTITIIIAVLTIQPTILESSSLKSNVADIQQQLESQSEVINILERKIEAQSILINLLKEQLYQK